MRKLDETVLELCDIVLTSDSGITSRVVRKHTDSDISHAMLYVQNHSLIDSTGDGVHASNTQRNLFADDSSVYVLRTRAPLTDLQKQSIVTYARTQIGTSYAKLQAAAVARLNPLKPSTTNSRKQFCSRLVAQAYAYAGIDLVETPDYCSPNDLKSSQLLEPVPTAIRTATEAEIAFANTFDSTKLMQDTSNALLTKAREKSGHIEAISDIDTHLFQHPADDQFMTDALKISGYLGVWRHDYKENPWHYDLDLMSEIEHTSAVEEYCKSTVSQRDTTERLQKNRIGYVQYFRSSNLQYFKELAELYKLLSDLDRKRLTVAQAWLSQLQNDKKES